MSIRVLARADEGTALRIYAAHPTRDYGYRMARQPIGGAVKRAMDVLIAGVALLALSPLLIIVALLIRLDSRGPVFFRQQRSGFRGKVFSIYKFRTMRTDACAGPVRQAQYGDSRVTRLGHFLRRTSIDELPQLLNVLRGEMSIVGPRPHAVTHDYDFCSVDGQYPRRFLARPGLTGLAQVSGRRGLTDSPDKVRDRLRLDLDYVDQWSVWRDVSIICKTAWIVLQDRNAF